jgi:hypothetical protein
MKRWMALAVAAALGLGCEGKNSPATAHRAELHKISGNVVEIVPNEGQPEWCLVYTIAEGSKTIRQLTMSRDNRSFACVAGKPIGNVTFRIPVDEGAVHVYVFFSDQRLNAGSLAQQLYDLSTRPNFNVLDLRAPGRIVSERFDFIPEEQAAPSVGVVIGEGGAAQDAGSAAPEPPAADAGPKTP